MNDYNELIESLRSMEPMVCSTAADAIEALQSRLEVTENAPDGIACRDMTIEMLEKRIEERELYRTAREKWYSERIRNGLDCALSLNSLRNAVNELRSAEHSEEQEDIRIGRISNAWVLVNELLDSVGDINRFVEEVEHPPFPSYDAWRNAVLDELVTLNIACKKHEDDPKFAVRDCINYHVQLALDPAISSQAQELIDRGRAEERAEREKQEPIATVGWDRNFMGVVWHGKDMPEKGVETLLYADPLVTAPVRLTDEQADTIWREIQDTSITSPEYPHRRFKNKIEAASLRANGFTVEE